MNGSQNLFKTGGGALSQTGNPQQIGGQSITEQRNDIQQPSTNDALNRKDLTITSVGSSTFGPITAVKSTNTSTVEGTSIAPIVIGVVITIIILGSLVILAITKGDKKQPSQAV